MHPLTDKSHEYLSVEDALARNNNVFITGAGGTGKSFLIYNGSWRNWKIFSLLPYSVKKT